MSYIKNEILSIPILQTEFNINEYIINNVSLNKISIIIKEEYLYLNVSLNYISHDSDEVLSVTSAPIYIHGEQFANFVNIKKLMSTVSELFNITINSNPPAISAYEYIPKKFTSGLIYD